MSVMQSMYLISMSEHKLTPSLRDTSSNWPLMGVARFESMLHMLNLYLINICRYSKDCEPQMQSRLIVKVRSGELLD